jgi:hypothetical protein
MADAEGIRARSDAEIASARRTGVPKMDLSPDEGLGSATGNEERR